MLLILKDKIFMITFKKGNLKFMNIVLGVKIEEALND